MSHKQNIFNVMFLSMVFTTLPGCGESSDVTLLKESTMNGYETTTVGGAFDSTFDNPSWQQFEGSKGERVVEFTGEISQSLHESYVLYVKNQYAKANPLERTLLQLGFINASVRKFGGPNGEVFEKLSEKYPCSLEQAYQKDKFGRPVHQVKCTSPSDVMGKNHDKEKYQNDLFEVYFQNLWRPGTPVEVQWIIAPDGASFNVSHMASEDWENLELTHILDVIYM